MGGRPRADAVRCTREAVRLWRTLGVPFYLASFLAGLAKMCEALGDTREALAAIEERLALAVPVAQRPAELTRTRLEVELGRLGRDEALARPGDEDSLDAAFTRWRLAPGPS